MMFCQPQSEGYSSWSSLVNAHQDTSGSCCPSTEKDDDDDDDDDDGVYDL